MIFEENFLFIFVLQALLSVFCPSPDLIRHPFLFMWSKFYIQYAMIEKNSVYMVRQREREREGERGRERDILYIRNSHLLLLHSQSSSMSVFLLVLIVRCVISFALVHLFTTYIFYFCNKAKIHDSLRVYHLDTLGKSCK